jgi:hypothetical protein
MLERIYGENYKMEKAQSKTNIFMLTREQIDMSPVAKIKTNETEKESFCEKYSLLATCYSVKRENSSIKSSP